MDITILHRLFDEYYELSMFPKVTRVLEKKEGRVVIKQREFAPKLWNIKDTTLRRYDIAATEKLINHRKAEIANYVYEAIVDYLNAKGRYTQALRAVSKDRTMLGPDSKMAWCRKVLYWMETYDLIPRMFVSPFLSHEGVNMGVKVKSAEEIFQEREESQDDETES